MHARVNLIRKDAGRYLAAIESDGIETFWGPTDGRSSVEPIYRNLRVISGSAKPWIKPGHILISPPITGGAYGGTRTVIEAAEREALKSDNRRKLGVAGGTERHLAVYVPLNSWPWLALVERDPPPVLPKLPPEITDVWMFSESDVKQEYVLWHASTCSPWRTTRVQLPY